MARTRAKKVFFYFTPAMQKWSEKLHEIVRVGNAIKLEKAVLLLRYWRLDILNQDGLTAMMIACQNDDIKCIELLLFANACSWYSE